jgi:uncharacterized glyoxalase superfamily protein PhnB
MSDIARDPFDALIADVSPLEPDARFADRLRVRLDTVLAAMAEPARPGTTTDPTIVPQLTVDGAAAAIEFYVEVFGAVEDHRLVERDGRIGHAQLVIGTSRIALADEYPDFDALAPTRRGGTSIRFAVEVTDADATVALAVTRGATVVRPVSDQFHGSRQGVVRDPFGHVWLISSPLAGFDERQYIANAAELGLEHRTGRATTTDRAPHPQSKHLAPGDLYYFALPTRDLERAQRFYGAVLGWQFADPMSGHVENISAPPGSLGADPSATATQLWFVVGDIHAAVERVRSAGGTATEPVLYASGWAADCVDDQGVAFSLSVPDPRYAS